MKPDELPPFTTIEKETVASTAVFRLERLRRRSGRTGKAHDFFRIDAPDWVNVVATTRAGELLLVRQERHGSLTTTLEIPGGVVDPGEDPAAAALRELEEETGHRGRRAEPLGWVHPNPAILSNRCHVFLVRDAEPGPGRPCDEDEEIAVEKVPLAEARRLVREGVITHALVVAALYLLDASPARR
jgi:8-oxo-dGTP pyrophosphatase MutT (NUDIX family)